MKNSSRILLDVQLLLVNRSNSHDARIGRTGVSLIKCSNRYTCVCFHNREKNMINIQELLLLLQSWGASLKYLDMLKPH